MVGTSWYTRFYEGQPLGQHWLKQPQYLDSIIESAQVDGSDNILEIGPVSDLTFRLTKKAAHVTAVELDDKLVDRFARMSLPANLEIVTSDIRDYDLSHMPVGYKVVANIPYYISGEIIQLC